LNPLPIKIKNGMTKAALLQELANNTWVRLKPSGLHGIGVFAIKVIPKGCKEMFAAEMGDWVTVDRKEVEALPVYAKDLVENFCLYDEANYFLPAHGFKSIDLSLFLNHADSPNIQSVNDGTYFEALRQIEEGEELVIDYGEIVSGEE